MSNLIASSLPTHIEIEFYFLTELLANSLPTQPSGAQREGVKLISSAGLEAFPPLKERVLEPILF